jgi:hypothetical protein
MPLSLIWRQQDRLVGRKITDKETPGVSKNDSAIIFAMLGYKNKQ